MKNQNGFTLVEVLIALLIGSVMMMGIYAAVNSAQSSSNRIERRVIAQQDARTALELMSLEISMASYNPTLLKIWVDTSCNDLAITDMLQLNRGILEATSTSLMIAMDINEDSVIGGAGVENEVIRYAYNSSSKYITRATSCGSNQPFLGAANASTVEKTVLVENDAAGVPLFRYYDGSGTELSSPVTGAIPDIRRIEVTLVVDTQHGDIGTGKRKRVIYSTSVIPRNHLSVPTYN